jgi:hypothetical protein
MNEVRATMKTTKGQRNLSKITDIYVVSQYVLNGGKAFRRLIAKSFWALAYLSGTVLTILTCVDLYNQYENYPFSSSVTNVHNSTIQPPDLSVCVPFDHNYIVKRMDVYLNYTPTHYRFNSADFFENAIDAMFFEIFDWQAMHDVLFVGDITYLAVSQTYLSIIFATEALRGFGGNPLSELDIEDNDEMQAIRDHFLPQLIEWNITIGQVKQPFSDKFLHYYPIMVNGSHDAAPAVQEFIFVSQQLVCYKLNFDGIQLELNDNIELVIERFWDQRENDVLAPAFVALDGKTTQLDRPDRFTYFANFRQSTYLFITPSVQYKALTSIRGTRSRPCIFAN